MPCGPPRPLAGQSQSMRKLQESSEPAYMFYLRGPLPAGPMLGVPGVTVVLEDPPLPTAAPAAIAVAAATNTVTLKAVEWTKEEEAAAVVTGMTVLNVTPFTDPLTFTLYEPAWPFDSNGGIVARPVASVVTVAMFEPVAVKVPPGPVCGSVKVRITPPTGFLLRSEEHTSELQSHVNLVCRLLLEKKNY